MAQQHHYSNDNNFQFLITIDTPLLDEDFDDLMLPRSVACNENIDTLEEQNPQLFF